MMMNETKIDEQLDIRGLNCPKPAFKAYKAIKNLEDGQVLEILTTARLTQVNIPMIVKRMKQELILNESTEKNVYRFLVRKVN